MDAKELFFANGESSGRWFCGECRTVCADKQMAEECCKKHLCVVCGKLVDEKHWMIHRDCRDKRNIERSEKLETWPGVVYLEGVGPEYFESINALVEETECEDIELPEYVFVCNEIPFKAPSMDQILEWSLDGHYEGAYDVINEKSCKNLSIALENFERDNSHIVSYEPDEKRMVRSQNVRTKNQGKGNRGDRRAADRQNGGY